MLTGHTVRKGYQKATPAQTEKFNALVNAIKLGEWLKSNPTMPIGLLK